MTVTKKTDRRRHSTPAAITDRANDTKKQTARWIILTLLLLAILPYLQTFRHNFVNYDDGGYVWQNPRVHEGLTWSNIAWVWTTTMVGNWQPITLLSHMLDCQLFGLRPGWHHLTSVLFHGANSVLVFLTLRSMTGTTWRSALVAALFAAHPLHVESVAWIAERKDVLSTFFGLLAIQAYVRYAREPSMGRFGWVMCFFALSLLSKPMLVTLPCLLLLLDIWPLQRFLIWNPEPGQSSRRSRSSNRSSKVASLLLEKLPLFLMSAAMSVVTYKVQHIVGAVATIDFLPFSQRVVNAIVAYATYLYKAFWPVNLAVIYPLQTKISVIQTALALVLLAGVTIGSVVLGRRRPWLIVGWLWYLGTLVPVIGLVQVGDQSMADRYTYLPLIGVFIMIAWSIPSEAVSPSPTWGRVITATVAVVLVALTAVTFSYVRVWKNTKTLFERALAVTKDNFTAHNVLASALGEEGDLAGARSHAEKALQMRPDYGGAHYNLGMIMLREGDFAKAQEQFTLALQTNPQDPMIWNGLGLANMSLGRVDEAISNYQHAVQLDPFFADAYLDLGAAFLAQGKYAEAVEASEKALRFRPDLAQTHVTLGSALLSLGKADESILHNRAAIAQNPNLTLPRINLAMGLMAKGNYDEAISHIEYVLRLMPQDEIAQKLLAAARQGRDASVPQR